MVTIVPAPNPAFGYERVLSEANVEQYAATAQMRPGGLSREGSPQTRRRVGRLASCPVPFISTRSEPVRQLGANAHGKVLYMLMGARSVLLAAYAVVIGIQAKWVGRTYCDRTLHIQRSVP
jgi:hypothetical protein